MTYEAIVNDYWVGNFDEGRFAEQYELADFVLLCYSMHDGESFKNVQRWLNAIRNHWRGFSVPIALIATQTEEVK